MDNPENVENYVSLKTLKTNMKDALKKSGVLSAVKAQVRREFINNLAPGTLGKENQVDPPSDSELLFRSAVFHFLKAKKWDYTLSVYSAECGVDGKSLLSESEVANKLHLDQSNTNSLSPSALEVIMRELMRKAEVVCVESSTQSDYSGAGIREMLDCRMNDLNRTYEHKKEQERLFPSRGIEEKMFAFQRDCEKRMREEFESQLDTMREVEIAKVRLEEAHKARLELESMRIELEANFERRMVVQSEREAESLRGAADRERQLQQAQYEARQRLQRELDDLRNREQNASKKLELDNQGLRLLESRLKEVQVSLESKEKELGRREREAEVNMRDATEKAREEARERLREELEALLRERSGLKTERTRLDADREAWDSVVADAAAWRNKCTTLETEVAQKEEEIISLKHRVARLDFRQKLEITEIAELTGMAIPTNGDEITEAVMADPFSNSSKSARTKHLLDLIQRNAELDARVKLLEEMDRENKNILKHERELRERADEQLRQKQDDLDRVIEFSKDFTVRVENERRRSLKEIEKLRRLVAVEKGRVTVATTQRAEIEHLVHEQRDAITQLQRSNKSMGHVKSIRSHVDANEDDTPVKSRTATLNSTSKMQTDIAAELEWLKRRRMTIENDESSKSERGKLAGSTPGSFIYGHELIIPQTNMGNSPPVTAVDGSTSPLADAATGVSDSARDELDRQRRILAVQKEEDRQRREYEELGREKRELELLRMKDLLQKQKEESELEELRRSSEEFAEKMRKQKEQAVAEKESQRQRQDDELRRQAANKLLEENRIAKSLRRDNEAKLQVERERADKELQFEADRQLQNNQRRETEDRNRMAREEEVRQEQTRQQQDIDSQAEKDEQERKQQLEADRRLQDDQCREAEEKDRLLRKEEARLEQVRKQREADSEAERDEQDRVQRLAKEEEAEREHVADLRRKEEEKDRERLAVEKQNEIERQEAADAARVSEESASGLLNKFRSEDEEERDRLQAKMDEEERQQREKDENDAEEERRRVLSQQQADEDARQKAAAEKSLAAKAEAERLRRAAEEAEQLELTRAREEEEAAEKEKQRHQDEAAAEERRKEEEARAAEDEAKKKKEDDANALQAARAKVLARRKQKQERDSLESLATDGTSSVRNSQSAPVFAAPKPEENMSIISEIEVAKTAEQSHSDDDIWF